VTRVRPERGNLWKDGVPSALSMREFTRGTLTMADDASLNVASACSGNTARYPRITIIPGTLAPYNPRRTSVSAGRSMLFRYFRINPLALGIGIVPQQYNFLVAYCIRSDIDRARTLFRLLHRAPRERKNSIILSDRAASRASD